MEILIQRDSEARDLPLPSYATAGAAGMDLCAALTEPLILLPGARALVSTGIRIALPEGYEAQVRPRSGLALRLGVGLLNAPGTIDCDYRGLISVILVNWGQKPVTLNRGDRVAQLVVAPVLRVAWQEGEVLTETVRSAGGFGSTGVGASQANK